MVFTSRKAMMPGAAQLVSLDNLISYWKLDEASGTRADSHGTNDLSDNNTVTQAAGKIGNAAQFTAANSERLSIASNASLNMGDDDLSMFVWVYFDDLSANMGIMGKANTGGSRDYWLIFNASLNRMLFAIRKGDDSQFNILAADSFGALSVDTWYFIAAWHDATEDTINIQINDGAVDSAVETAGLRNELGDFHIGYVSGAYLNGRADEASLWTRVLSEEERTSLYNGGDGLAYPFCVGGGTGCGESGSENDAPELATMEEDEFMVTYIPDTQVYMHEGTPEFEDMTEWIAEHAADNDKNIQMVLHEGDVIYSSKGDLSTQFARADAAMDTLDAAGIPYLMCMGNHDYDTDTPPPADRSHTQFDGTFPQSRFTSQPGWSGDFYSESSHDGNAYWARTIGGNDYLFLAISFGPTQDVLDWAKGVIDDHPNHDVWIVTHAYMYRDGTRLGEGDQWNPHDIFPDGTDTHDGEEMWAELKSKANIVWIQNGHDGISGVDEGWVQARRQDNDDNGNLVNQVVANYHTTAHGGKGYMRLVAVRPSKNQVDVYTYSPNLDDWFRNDANEFSVDYRNG